MSNETSTSSTSDQYVKPQVVRERPRGGFPWRGLFLFFFFGGGALLLLGIVLIAMVGSSGSSNRQLEEKNFSVDRWKDGQRKVAVIDVSGPILELDGDSFIRRQIDQVTRDKDVEAVVLRINSPGGTISGSDFIYHHLELMRKSRGEDDPLPMIVSMGAIAASGGYYIAMAVGDDPDSIYVEPTTWTGSIGVIIPHYDLSGFLKEHDIQDDSIKSHPLKGLGSMTTPMTEQERGILQGLVDDSFVRFKDIVRAGRPKLAGEGALDPLATGQIFDAKQALKNGLADKEGFIEDAILAAMQSAGIPESDAKVIKYKQTPSLFDALSGNVRAATSSPLDLRALVNLSTPQAYYLFTSLPVALQAR